MTEAAHSYGALHVSKRRDLEQTSQVSEPRNESMQTSNANGAASRSLGMIMLSQTKAHVALCHVLRGPIADLKKKRQKKQLLQKLLLQYSHQGFKKIRG